MKFSIKSNKSTKYQRLVCRQSRNTRCSIVTEQEIVMDGFSRFLQVALLYTSLSAQRRVRVLNMALMSCNDYAELYRTTEIDVIINFMIKNSTHVIFPFHCGMNFVAMRHEMILTFFRRILAGVKGLYDFSPAAIREGLTERSTKILSAYRNHCSQKTGQGQLVLPETLKLLPIYTGCLVRNDIISGLGKMILLSRNAQFLRVVQFIYNSIWLCDWSLDWLVEFQIPKSSRWIDQLIDWLNEFKLQLAFDRLFDWLIDWFQNLFDFPTAKFFFQQLCLIFSLVEGSAIPFFKDDFSMEFDL